MKLADKIRKKIFFRYSPQVYFSLDYVLVAPQVLPKALSGKGVVIGVDDLNREVFFNPLEAPNPHWIIVGKSGAGKSLFIKFVSLGLQKDYQMIFIDPHGDYNRLVSLGLGGIVFDVEETIFDPLSFVHHARNTDAALDDLADIVKEAFNLSEEERSIVREALECMDLTKALSRLPRFLRTKLKSGFLFFANKKKIDIGELIAERTHFSLSFRAEVGEPLRPVIAKFITGLFLKNLIHFIWGREKHRPERIVVIDEAHNVLSYQEFLVKLFEEVRKTGTGIWASSQNLDNFSIRHLDLVGGMVVLSPVSRRTLYKLDGFYDFSLADKHFIETKSPREEWFPEKCLLIYSGRRPIRVFLKIGKEVLKY